MADVREVNELARLEDDAFVNSKEAAAFLNFAPDTLNWYRKCAPERSPKFYKIGSRAIRYRMGDLRAYRNGEPQAYQIPRVVKEG